MAESKGNLNGRACNKSDINPEPFYLVATGHLYVYYAVSYILCSSFKVKMIYTIFLAYVHNFLIFKEWPFKDV